MKYLLTGNEMAQADSLTSEVIGIPSIVLMERAALAVAGEIRSRTAQGARVTILAGPGNNGADGLAVGRLLTDCGYDVQYLLLSMKEPPEGSSAMTQKRGLQARESVSIPAASVFALKRSSGIPCRSATSIDCRPTDPVAPKTESEAGNPPSFPFGAFGTVFISSVPFRGFLHERKAKPPPICMSSQSMTDVVKTESKRSITPPCPGKIFP